MTLSEEPASGMTMAVDVFLADSADVVEGKIYALGIGWNTIHAPAFPTVHPRVAVGAIIHVPYTATNVTHTFRLHLQDQDGNRVHIGTVGSDAGSRQIYELGGQFTVGRPPMLPPGDEQVVPLAVTINGLRLDKPDLYAWVLTIDDMEARRLPMRVLRTGTAPAR